MLKFSYHNCYFKLDRENKSRQNTQALCLTATPDDEGISQVFTGTLKSG
jgi:hypothetical protein